MLTFPPDHLCKPDLSIINPADPAFIAWRTAMFTLSKCDEVYIKLSGLFNEMPPALRTRAPTDVFLAAHPWMAVLLAAFGASRTMFGSDWPVCTAAFEGEEDQGAAWAKWRAVVEKVAYMASLEEEDEKMLWGGTAMRAYGLEVEEEDGEESE
jgi:L-rhamnono-1,4-lactonase